MCLFVQEWRDGLPALGDCDPGILQSYNFQSDSPQGSTTLGHTQVSQIAKIQTIGYILNTFFKP